MYNKSASSRKVGDVFGVSKDQIQALEKRKAEVLEEYRMAHILTMSWSYKQ